MFEIDSGRLRALVIERALTVRDFARAARLNGKTAAKLLHDGATANLKTVGALSKFFGVDANALIKRGE